MFAIGRTALWVCVVTAGLQAAEVVIPLTILGQSGVDPCEVVFGVPVECNGVKDTFAWNCAGTSRVSESFAKQAKLKILPGKELTGQLDAAGKPLYLGQANTEVVFGGKTIRVAVAVKRDEICLPPEKAGTLGYDVVREFQSTVDPGRRTLTLRPFNSPPTTRPIASIPLKQRDLCFWINVKIRNAPVDCRLMPGATNIQADPDLQRRWDLGRGRDSKLEFLSVGNVRHVNLRGKDTVEISKDVAETNLTVLLLGDPKKPSKAVLSSGLGANLLNRFVYCIDPGAGKFMILGRSGTTDKHR